MYRGIRKIEEIVIPESSCIMVEGGNYLVGKELLPTHNTTIVTEGGTIWELLRNPDLRIRITNAIAEKAVDFLRTVKETFESNQLIRELYPEYCPPTKNIPRWNSNEIVLPNRPRAYREANVETGGIEGANEGHHHDLHIVDDMIGLAALNSMRQTNAVMYSTKHWFWGSDSLLIAPARSRIIVVGTRFAIDDVYGEILVEGYEVTGYPLPGWTPNREGQWKIYYRRGIEDGNIIFPENFDTAFYERLAKKNWWDYVTQYLNDPSDAGLTDLSSYQVGSFEMECSAENGEWFIILPFEDKIPLCDCDVIVAGDPAATERYISAKTSRSAVVVLAQDSAGRKFVLSIQADYITAMKFFDWLFAAKTKFGRYVRATYLEASGPFKILGPLIRQEEQFRKMYLNLQSFPAVGDKDARIRSALDAELSQHNLYIAKPFLELFEHEQKAFPQATLKDILDAVTTALRNSTRPPTPDEEQAGKDEDEWWRNRSNNAAGY